MKQWREILVNGMNQPILNPAGASTPNLDPRFNAKMALVTYQVKQAARVSRFTFFEGHFCFKPRKRMVTCRSGKMGAIKARLLRLTFFH